VTMADVEPRLLVSADRALHHLGAG
jgi:hypothetical protein